MYYAQTCRLLECRNTSVEMEFCRLSVRHFADFLALAGINAFANEDACGLKCG